jgi:hypothetical protein
MGGTVVGAVVFREAVGVDVAGGTRDCVTTSGVFVVLVVSGTSIGCIGVGSLLC